MMTATEIGERIGDALGRNFERYLFQCLVTPEDVAVMRAEEYT